MSKIIFMGSPEIAVPSLRALHAAGHQILGVVTQPDKPQGRGQKMGSPAVKLAALELGLPVWQPEKLKNPEWIAQLQQLVPDFICVVAYGKILPPDILKIPRYGCINLHFSLLPKYRGAACVAYPLIQGDTDTGVTTILMDEGMDTGPILMQWTEPILPEDTTQQLSQRLAVLGAQQLVKTVEALLAQSIEAIPQQGAQASMAPLLKKETGHVNWSKSAEEIYNLYRGLTPWPGLFAFLEGKRVLLTKIRVASGPSPLAPLPRGEGEFITKSGEESPSPRGRGNKGEGTFGAIDFGPNGEMHVHCGSGTIEILQLKPEGKKVLNAKDFMRGLQKTHNLIFT